MVDAFILRLLDEVVLCTEPNAIAREAHEHAERQAADDQPRDEFFPSDGIGRWFRRDHCLEFGTSREA